MAEFTCISCHDLITGTIDWRESKYGKHIAFCEACGTGCDLPKIKWVQGTGWIHVSTEHGQNAPETVGSNGYRPWPKKTSNLEVLQAVQKLDTKISQLISMFGQTASASL